MTGLAPHARLTTVWRAGLRRVSGKGLPETRNEIKLRWVSGKGFPETTNNGTENAGLG